MVDKKLTNPLVIEFRRSMAARELALDTSYPRTHTGTAGHRKRTESGSRVTPLIVWPASSIMPGDSPEPPESVAKPWKKPWDI
jgi:hypothetical protein